MFRTLILSSIVLGKVSSFGTLLSSKHLQTFGTTALNVNLLVGGTIHSTERSIFTKLLGRFKPDALLRKLFKSANLKRKPHYTLTIINYVSYIIQRLYQKATDDSSSSHDIVPGKPTWQQSMLRIADPQKSIPFYTDVMGMTVIDTLDFPQWTFKIFFLTTLPEGETYDLTPGTQEAHDYMWSIEGTALELTYNYGTEEESFKGYHPGNEEKDGFGHIAFNTDDVYAACEKLEAAGVSFKKKPDEGR